MTCVCDEKSPCLYHKEKGMHIKDNETEEAESIHYDLEQTLREARRESGMTLRSIASVIVEVLAEDEIKSLVHEIYAASEPAVQEGSSKG